MLRSDISLWPSCARFCCEYNLKPGNPPGRDDFWFLAEEIYFERRSGAKWIDEIERDLEVGYRTGAITGAIDNAYAKRLACRDTNYLSARAELRVGRLLTEAGMSIQEWEPKAKDGKRGDLIVSDQWDTRIFVEVKAFGGDAAYHEAKKVADALRPKLYSTFAGTYPGLSCRVYIDTFAPESVRYDFDSRVRLVDNLVNRLASAVDTAMSATEYSGVTTFGDRVSVKRDRSYRPVTVSTVGLVKPECALRRRLQEVREPLDDIPCLATIYDRDQWFVKFGESPVDTVAHAHLQQLSVGATGCRAIPPHIDAVLICSTRVAGSAAGGETRLILYIRDTDHGHAIKRLLSPGATLVSTFS